MSESIDRPLLLNDSIKDSIDQPPSNSLSKPKQEIAAPSVVQEDLPSPSTKKAKTMRRYTILQVSSIICILIGLVFIFALPPFIESMIVEQAKEQVIMTSDNEGLWAHFPGDTDTIIVRNFTFFKLHNEEQFLLHGEKPQFIEVGGYKIQELEDFLDITYLEDGNKVKIRDWTRFAEWYQSRSLDQQVNLLNMGNLGYWSTLKLARPTLLLQQGLALLFTNMEISLIPTVIGSGINQQFLKDINITLHSLLIPAGVDVDNAHFIWNDIVLGLSDKANVGQWSQAAADCFDQEGTFSFSSGAIAIKNYFTLSDQQTEYLMQRFNEYNTNLNSLLLENHYCDDIEMQNCTGRYLSIAQLAQAYMTSNTPPVSTISGNDTICDDNVTCKGLYPELYAYYKNVYKKQGFYLQQQKILPFNEKSIHNWFNYNNSIQKGLNYSTAQNCLLHIGNLDQLWTWGTAYDKTNDTANLQLIMKRFQLDTVQQSHVFWAWLKYLSNDFVLQKANNAKLGISTLFTQGIYEQFSYLQDNLHRMLIAKILTKQLSTMECHDFFKNSLDEEQGSELVNSLCHHYLNIHTQEFAYKMVDVCELKFGQQWNFIKGQGAMLLGMQSFCDPLGNDNLGGMLHKIKVSIDHAYNCNTTPFPYCSNFELAVLQWQTSIVTLNPPTELIADLEATTTYANWDNKMKPIEYWHFKHKFSDEQQQKFPVYSVADLFKKFTFQQWFSSSVILKDLSNNNIHPYLMKYVRYICIFITLNGFTTMRTPREILFGYEDEFLASVKNAYPPFGGDPSAPSIIALNELNFTKEEASMSIVFKTGKDDYRNVYQNYQINGYRYSVNNYTWFNGNKTMWEWRSPWAQNDYFYGTTAKIFAPDQFQADNMSLLIPQVQRYGSNHFHGQSYKQQRFGIDLYISYLNKKIGQVSPDNDKYYQSLPNIFNVSSIYGLPLYITKNHFMNCTEWIEKVDIFNQDQSIHYKETSHWDDTFILVEPYTGVSFQSVIYLQNNYFHQPDELYDYPQDVFLPIFSISRSGNLTQQKFHHYFDPLLTAFTAKKAVVYIGISLAGVFVILIGFATFKKRKLSKLMEEEQEETGSLKSQGGISLQRREDNSLLQTQNILQGSSDEQQVKDK